MWAADKIAATAKWIIEEVGNLGETILGIWADAKELGKTTVETFKDIGAIGYECLIQDSAQGCKDAVAGLKATLGIAQVKLGGVCDGPLACIGYTAPSFPGVTCCNNKCQKRVRDWAGFYFCEHECRGAWYKGEGTCDVWKPKPYQRCPTYAEVRDTPDDDRWDVWAAVPHGTTHLYGVDMSKCGCRFASEDGQCTMSAGGKKSAVPCCVNMNVFAFGDPRFNCPDTGRVMQVPEVYRWQETAALKNFNNGYRFHSPSYWEKATGNSKHGTNEMEVASYNKGYFQLAGGGFFNPNAMQCKKPIEKSTENPELSFTKNLKAPYTVRPMLNQARCPSASEVFNTPPFLRWKTWDDPTCTQPHEGGCRMPPGQCGDSNHKDKKKRAPCCLRKKAVFSVCPTKEDVLASGPDLSYRKHVFEDKNHPSTHMGCKLDCSDGTVPCFVREKPLEYRCPTEAEVYETFFTDRWDVWNDPKCETGCTLNCKDSKGVLGTSLPCCVQFKILGYDPSPPPPPPPSPPPSPPMPPMPPAPPPRDWLGECKDNPEYADKAYGSTCWSWGFFACDTYLGKSGKLGTLDAAAFEELVANCPQACKKCETPCSQSCKDDPNFKDGYYESTCAQWDGWACDSYEKKIGKPNVEALLKACPKACGTCKPCHSPRIVGAKKQTSI